MPRKAELGNMNLKGFLNELEFHFRNFICVKTNLTTKLMKNKYLVLSLIGFILPNYFSIMETIKANNILLWTDLEATMGAMFGNYINAAFSTDLLWVVLVFIVFLWSKVTNIGTKKAWLLTVLTFLFGMAGPFPLLLHWLDKSNI